MKSLLSVVLYQTMEHNYNELHYLGVVSLLKLGGYGDLIYDIENCNWTALRKIYQKIHQLTYDPTLEDESRETAEEFFKVVKKKMGVYFEEPDDIPRVLSKLKDKATENEKRVIDKMIDHYNKEEYFDIILASAPIIEEISVLSILISDCCGLILDSIEV